MQPSALELQPNLLHKDIDWHNHCLFEQLVRTPLLVVRRGQVPLPLASRQRAFAPCSTPRCGSAFTRRLAMGSHRFTRLERRDGPVMIDQSILSIIDYPCSPSGPHPWDRYGATPPPFSLESLFGPSCQVNHQNPSFNFVLSSKAFSATNLARFMLQGVNT